MSNPFRTIPNETKTVTLLKDRRSEVIGVYASAVDAQLVAHRYNADPDEDAPYTAETWVVQEDCSHVIGSCEDCSPTSENLL